MWVSLTEPNCVQTIVASCRGSRFMTRLRLLLLATTAVSAFAATQGFVQAESGRIILAQQGPGPADDAKGPPGQKKQEPKQPPGAAPPPRPAAPPPAAAPPPPPAAAPPPPRPAAPPPPPAAAPPPRPAPP